jgi:hypothetical protein
MALVPVVAMTGGPNRLDIGCAVMDRKKDIFGDDILNIERFPEMPLNWLLIP